MTTIAFEPDEYVIHVVHKHWFVFLTRFIVISLVAVAPFVLLPLVGFVPEANQGTVVTMFTFAYMLYALVCWMVLFLMWTDYYLDMAIITNKRIMDVEQRGLFSREVSSMRFETIQDLTSNIVGVIPTLLHFGEVRIQTAATTREFVLDEVANPEYVKEVITKELSRIVEKKVIV
jgi:hypothetical protein